MANKKNEKVILENVELKPQVIGKAYKKKSNLGRVIFIFIVFSFVIYYINDISIWINNLIGKKSPETIENLANSNNNKNEDKENLTNKEVVYNIFSNNLTISEGKMVLNKFSYKNNKLLFDIENSSNIKIDVSDKKYFLETYSEDKTLLERFKLDVNIINESSKISIELDIKNNFYYLVLVEKKMEDYPVVNLKNDELGMGKITCTKGIENIIYTFKNGELEEINHTITDNNIKEDNYYNRYNSYQNKVSNYNNLAGISATFNGSLTGFTAVIVIDLKTANLTNLNEKYYYSYKEIPKVVKFEQETRGFSCN